MHGRPLHQDPRVTEPAQRPHLTTVPHRDPASLTLPVAGARHSAARPAPASVDYTVATALKRQVADHLAKEVQRSSGMSESTRQQLGRDLINQSVALWADAAAIERGHSTTPAEEKTLSEAVFDLLFRAGRLQRYLDDADVENILVNGFDDVWIDFGDARRQQVPPVAESDEDLIEILRDLARRSGQGERTLSTSSPMLALRLQDGSRLQAMTGVTQRPMVTIRRHRVRDSDLDDMIALGTIDPTLATFLSALIRAKKNVLIAGTQGVGKTSLMRSMAREIPRYERIGTLESEYELFLHELGHHEQVVAMEARESNGERVDGQAAGEITLGDLIPPALRMTLSRMIVGEVRGKEVVPMLQAMTNGEGGSLCTIHAREPQMVFDRVAELYVQSGEGFSESLAYRQIANGVNFVVFVRMVDETGIGGRRHRFVSHVLEVTGSGENGRPATNLIFGPRPETEELRAVPLMHPSCLGDLMRVGFDGDLLNNPYGTWGGPLDVLVRV